MKNLSLSSIMQVNSFSSDAVWLIALKIHVRDHTTGAVVDQIRVVNNSEITIIEDEEYEPMSFSIDIKEETNQLPTVSITIQDQAEIVGGYMQRYGGGVGFNIDLMIIRASTATDTYVEPELVEFFVVTTSSYKDYVASWNLGAENPLRKMFPLRKQEKDQCGFRYKQSDTCGYVGSKPTCDLSLDGANGCRAHNNAPNYGAFPGIIARG